MAGSTASRRTKTTTTSSRSTTSSTSSKSSSRRLGSSSKTSEQAAEGAAPASPVTSARSRAPRSATPTRTAKPATAGTAADDTLHVALEVWRAVVAALEQARYREIGPAYAKLSTLLVQQRTVELLSDPADRAEWVELSRTAQEAVTLLEPVMTAARQLVALPSRIDVERGTTQASPDAAKTSAGRPARRRTPKK